MPLVIISPSRRSREALRATEIARGQRAWRRTWMRAYLQCLGLVVLGNAIYAASWHAADPIAIVVLQGAGFFTAYALPLVRLAGLLLRHGDQF